MQHLDIRRKGLKGFPLNSYAVLAQVRFLAYHRIKPHVPPLVRLRRGLPGYLILFAPHAFVLERR